MAYIRVGLICSPNKTFCTFDVLYELQQLHGFDTL